MGFEVAIVVILILFGIYAGFHYYQLNQKSQMSNLMETFQSMNNVEDVRDLIEVPFDMVKEHETIQHIGWLHKNGVNQDKPLLNLYFDQTNASFFCVTLNNDKTKLIIQKDMLSDGEEVSIKGDLHIVKMMKD